MNEIKVKVPEGMLNASQKAAMESIASLGFGSPLVMETVLEAALRWLSENPILPTDEVIWDMERNSFGCSSPTIARANNIRSLIKEWQRRMFLAPEPEVEQSLEDRVHNLERQVTAILRNK